jgi:hypothetical protein
MALKPSNLSNRNACCLRIKHHAQTGALILVIVVDGLEVVTSMGTSVRDSKLDLLAGEIAQATINFVLGV